jgi:hypothetical protein
MPVVLLLSPPGCLLLVLHSLHPCIRLQRIHTLTHVPHSLTSEREKTAFDSGVFSIRVLNLRQTFLPKKGSKGGDPLTRPGTAVTASRITIHHPVREWGLLFLSSPSCTTRLTPDFPILTPCFTFMQSPSAFHVVIPMFFSPTVSPLASYQSLLQRN